jgi:hypothetical protein
MILFMGYLIEVFAPIRFIFSRYRTDERMGHYGGGSGWVSAIRVLLYRGGAWSDGGWGRLRGWDNRVANFVYFTPPKAESQRTIPRTMVVSLPLYFTGTKPNASI